MEHCEELVKYIINRENRNAIDFLRRLREEPFCSDYLFAREKVLIIEAAKMLSMKLPFLYADEKSLAEKLFSGKISSEEAIKLLCDLVRNSANLDRQSAFCKATEFIGKNLTKNQLTVGAVADYTGITQVELVKLFKENIQTTPGDYIGKKRAENSISYLKKNISVEKTACAIGFSSVETYIRTFKKHIGITPGMWKKKYL